MEHVHEHSDKHREPPAAQAASKDPVCGRRCEMIRLTGSFMAGSNTACAVKNARQFRDSASAQSFRHSRRLSRASPHALARLMLGPVPREVRHQPRSLQ